jgi:hypothetical protein
MAKRYERLSSNPPNGATPTQAQPAGAASVPVPSGPLLPSCAPSPVRAPFPSPRRPDRQLGRPLLGRAAAKVSVGAAETTPQGAYARAEFARRVGVASTTLRRWEKLGHIGPSAERGYTAYDLVRVEALGRLVRSGVPVGLAASLIDAAASTRHPPVTREPEPAVDLG